MEENNDMNDMTAMKQRANYFYDNKQAVHITLKSNRFYNGVILIVKSDFLLILDRRLGELPCFFLEIKSIEPYNMPGEEVGNGNN